MESRKKPIFGLAFSFCEVQGNDQGNKEQRLDLAALHERRVIAFLTDGDAIRDILTHLGEPTSPPRLMPARGPPLRESRKNDDEQVSHEDRQVEPVPEYQLQG